MSPWVHDSAIVDEGAELGAGVKVWHFSHVCAGARVGEDSSLGQNVYVASSALIGKRCRIQNNVSIYDGVELQEEVFCGPSVVFTNVSNPRAAINRKNQYRPTVVRRGASLGANATIIAGVSIGRYAFIAAGAVVTHDVPDFGLAQGVPARLEGWMSKEGERIPLPTTGDGNWTCPLSGTRYRLSAGVLSLWD